MTNWSRITVGQLVDANAADIKTGPFGTQLRASDYVEAGTPVINVRNIGFGRLKAEKLEFVDEGTVARLQGHRLSRNDIVFARKGAVERHMLVTTAEDGWMQGSDCLRLRLDGCVIDPVFVSYSLLRREHQTWIAQQASHGATMPTLNQAIISRIDLRVPPMRVQKRIASILGAYDDLIEVNRRRIAVLEEMARRLFEEWFVHFRFPGHTHRTVDAPAIPQGWRIGQLGDLISLVYGKALKATDRAPGQVPVIGSSGVVGHHNEALVRRPGIVLGRKGNVGSVVWSPVPFFPIDTVFYVESAYPPGPIRFSVCEALCVVLQASAGQPFAWVNRSP